MMSKISYLFVGLFFISLSFNGINCGSHTVIVRNSTPLNFTLCAAKMDTGEFSTVPPDVMAPFSAVSWIVKNTGTDGSLWMQVGYNSSAGIYFFHYEKDYVGFCEEWQTKNCQVILNVKENPILQESKKTSFVGIDEDCPCITVSDEGCKVVDPVYVVTCNSCENQNLRLRQN
eukprot:c21218_g1_i3.p1 GENE.c21218_g1_i3~~c21218_g1_i3.p1  ORF type:complete len:173 (+),score=76.28 c21218_g1_i3:29-547(+)